ncbi:C39 family peptidase [Tenacibaculum caenipelagi]|uniref:Papain like cysteine protease AvrRpt2 n=1 Tax=Tenacibaculum caenipelagi TaxID=1325435 RepID=A0A4R6THK4_9FLAO|nr:C39 family peptidase [Tenacibaculum caenipelagi]TDQ28690.1 papain like cysteine protease AvrRpt2 [Tenacibaculum caenipelagi]
MKNKILVSTYLLIFIALLPVNQIIAQQAKYVGISSNSMNYFAAKQNNSQWCWAASIQMVLNGYGVNINQQQIVARTYGTDPYGNLPNWPGSFQAIHSNLNNWGIDNYGYPYTVRASIGMGTPSPAILIQELSNGRPVIIGYKSSPNGGHAVVVTAVSYINTWNGPMIQTIVVRDPWPSPTNINNLGRVEYPAVALANKIQAYWYIRVIK